MLAASLGGSAPCGRDGHDTSNIPKHGLNQQSAPVHLHKLPGLTANRRSQWKKTSVRALHAEVQHELNSWCHDPLLKSDMRFLTALQYCKMVHRLEITPKLPDQQKMEKGTNKRGVGHVACSKPRTCSRTLASISAAA